MSDGLQLNLETWATALRQFADALEMMERNVRVGQPSALISHSTTVNERGEREEHVGHYTLERVAEELEASARQIRRAAQFEREVRERAGHDALSDDGLFGSE
jgi:hypothetical protein